MEVQGLYSTDLKNLLESQTRFSLAIDELFLDQFFRLNNKAASKVINALQNASFGIFHFWASDVPRRRRHTQPFKKHRFQKLCIKSIEQAVISYSEGMGIFGGMLLRSLSQIETLVIVASADSQGTRDLADMIKGLRWQQSLETITISTPPHFYRVIVPELCLMTKKVKSLEFHGAYDPKPVSTTDARALMQLLNYDVSLRVVMKDINFAAPETHVYLCKMLSRMKRESLVIRNWRMKNPAKVANALAQSAIKLLDVSLELKDKSSIPFFVGLGSSLSPATRLEELVCTLGPSYHFDESTDRDECLVAVARGAAHCPNLKCLKLDLGSTSALADEALGECIARNSSLMELDVTCPIRSRYTTTDSVQVPKLYEALKFNVTIQYIRLCRVFYSDIEPWDPDFKREIEAIVSLNRIGRHYIIDDPANKVVGIRLLEQVIDDSSCLFFHLRENPLLCYREPHGSIERHYN